MRIVDRKTFLTLPPGTVYMKYEPCHFQEFAIKQETCGENDWVYLPLDTPHFEGTSSDVEWVLALEQMEQGGTRSDLDMEATSRDGFFDDDQLFFIYEEEEVRRLIAALSSTLTLKPGA